MSAPAAVTPGSTPRAPAPPAVRTAPVSVVVPTLDRPDDVQRLLDSLAAQTVRPAEVVLVDGAPPALRETEALVARVAPALPFRVVHVRHAGGTAIQRNVGIDHATGEFVAFIDDDMLLAPDFLAVVLDVHARHPAWEGRPVGGVVGYIDNQYFDGATSPRWRWYRRLGLFTTWEPGRFDLGSGYPINRYLQPPHDGVRAIDFCGTNCAVWRRAVFADGLRFAPFFVGYGMMEDAHLALSAQRRGWVLLEAGAAHCTHNHSARARTDARRIARKTAVNYRFLFVDIVPRRTLAQECRWWRVQGVDLVRLAANALRRPTRTAWATVLGKCEGILAATRVRPGMEVPP